MTTVSVSVFTATHLHHGDVTLSEAPPLNGDDPSVNCSGSVCLHHQLIITAPRKPQTDQNNSVINNLINTLVNSLINSLNCNSVEPPPAFRALGPGLIQTQLIT